MNFAELHFWFYLACILGPVLAIRPMYRRLALGGKSNMARYDRTTVLIVGLFLLGCVSPTTLAIFLFVCVVTYLGLNLYLRSKGKHRTAFLFVLVPLQLLPLAYYKYGHFGLNGILQLNLSGLSELAVPVGLSFYTFQVVGFVIDTVIHQHPLPRFLDFMNFAGFFPQIVAGPIERRENLLPQMENFRFQWDAQAINEGAKWIVLGLFFKLCLADNLAIHFDPSTDDNSFLIWLNNLIFGLRIYYDFAGYSFIALGVARCLGIRLTLNFASPYLACDAQDFWRRWHITLSTWFRDYIYLPLGGSHTKMWVFSILAVFVVSGIWHGAGWNFMLWGGLWGLMLIGFHFFKRFKLPRLLGWPATMLGAFFAWLCFYETRTGILLDKLLIILNPLSYNIEALHQALATFEPGKGLVLATFLLLSIATLATEYLSLRRHGEPYALFQKPGVLFILVIMTVLLNSSAKNDFIYFAF